MISYLNPIPSLPSPFGPHKVGTSEWEVPVSEIPSSSQVPDPTVSTIKFRLYYPTTSSAPTASIKWLPQPQNQWIEAYSSFLGAGARLASFLSALPSLIKYTTIPASPDAPLLSRTSSSKYPVVVFSHGLGGNFNTYSSICTALASFGIVCVAPEHRDGSAPISFIRSSSKEHVASIPYQKHSHSPTAEVLNARNAQLRIRLWELEQLYTVLTALDAGKTFSNYAASHGKTESLPSLKSSLDLEPGHITWAGHSFGAATTVQFAKSVYYHQHLPQLTETQHEDSVDWRPLYTPAENGELVQQITPDSPIALLDLWTMPLRGELTQWLWEKPLPCYDRATTPTSNHKTNVVAIMSTEFHKWTDLLNRTKATLTHRPAEAIKYLEAQKSSTSSESQTSPQMTAVATPPGKTPSNLPIPFPDEDQSPSSSKSSSTDSSRTSTPSPSSSSPSVVSTSSADKITEPSSLQVSPSLYLVPNSAHLSQSDFGLLFPNLTRYLMKAQDPQKTIELNVRAILAVMRGRGLEVENFKSPGAESMPVDSILSQEGVEDRFLRLSLD